MLKKIKTICGKIRRYIYYASYKIFNLFPINNSSIIADNFCGKKYGDSPAAIIDELLRNKKNLKIFWVLNKYNYDSILPEGVKSVKFNSFKHFYLLATSKIWIDNVRKPLIIRKRNEQFYIQTWHGGFGFKRIEKDLEGVLPKEYFKIAKNDSKNISLLITNSKWQTDYFRKCFYYNGEILSVGIPRNDILFQKEKHNLIRKTFLKNLNIDEETKILLYAPTFRDDKDTSCYNINFDKVLSILKEKTSSNWKILIKLHPNISNLDIFDSSNEDIINVSNYYSLNDIMISSDMLISDYSSLVFDYSYLLKPIILYATDIEKYNSDRGFLFNIKELPFPLTTNNKELLNYLSDFSKTKYLKNLNEFYKKYGLNETGNASKEIVNIINKIISE